MITTKLESGHGPVRFMFGTFGTEPEPEHYVQVQPRLNQNQLDLNIMIMFGSGSNQVRTKKYT